MADGTPVTYEELPDELKKRYDEIKVTLEADLIGSFREPVPMASDGRDSHRKEAELAVAGLATQLKDMASQADYPSLAHMVQKLSHMNSATRTCTKFKRAVVLVDAEEDGVLRETKK
ncbi:hypothetical protein QYE76_068204 [Lolium multiflorum]|uniref:Uncharacterized protein n=1 Tax=Lolium multiflorum TaxID=4521 RepID=A0AAD8SEA9_LOLMU|nr:hypothetical protein QYE76_068204 [Lolium multiflorum]